LKQYELAAKDYTEVLIIDHENIHALHNRGITLERLKRFSDAIEDFSAVI
jgi:tetratricopeptide (TPR) repeat protein